MSEHGRIAKGGAGGFLDPPGHPEHEWHVQTDLRRRPENRGSMSLTYAAGEARGLDDGTRAAARAMLNDWRPEPIDSPRVREWRLQVLGYFKGMYGDPRVPESVRWNVDRLLSLPDWNPVLNARKHAGVRWIWQFYPHYQPTAADFQHARWGKASGDVRRRRS